MSRPEEAKVIVFDGDSIQIDGVEFPWYVATQFEVETLVDDPDGPPLHGVTVTIFAERVEVRNLKRGVEVAYSRGLRVHSPAFATGD